MDSNFYNINMERAVLASFLFAPELFEDNLLNSSDFYLPVHKNIYEAMKALDAREEPICEDFLHDELTKNGKWDEQAMLDILSTNWIPDVTSYVKEIRKKASYRYFYCLADEVKKRTKESVDIHEIADFISNKTDSIVDGSIGVRIENLRDFVIGFEHELKTAGTAVDGITGYRTGLTTLDNKTNGFEAGELVVIAGRPGMGKTAMGTTIANYCDLNNVGVLFDSLEMSGTKIVRRLVANRAEEKLHELKRGLFANHARATKAINDLKTSQNLILHSLYYPTIEQLCAKAGKVFRHNNHIKVWIIDHLKHIKKKSIGSYEVSNEIAEQLKSIIKTAKEYGVVPIVLHQLSRANEARNNKRPSLSDLGQSSAIEELASWVIFPYRSSYYERLDTNMPEPAYAPSEMIIAKARDGEAGVAECFFAGQHSRFQSYCESYAGDASKGFL
ncbi:MAG: AAA family ATPase [Campylobacteraceae bacterium]|jgi:replicative DNA helicase|nr:AAA family ATPase [Campylobacteraceae bacterium]